MRALLRAMVETGGAAVATLVLGVVSVKVMAVTLGPAGTGLYNILQQVLAVAVTIATLNGAQAIVQGVAARSGRSQEHFVATTGWVCLGGSVLVSIPLVLLAPHIARAAGDVPTHLIQWLALPLGISTMYVYSSSVLSGLLQVRRVAIIRLSGALGTAVVVYPLSVATQSSVMLYILLVSSSIVVQTFLSLRFARRSGMPLPFGRFSKTKFRRFEARKFVRVSSGLFIAGLTGSASHLLLTAAITHRLGLSAAGIFNAAWNLSMQYVGLVLLSMGTYYLPALGRTRGGDEGMGIVSNVVKLVALVSPVVVTAAVVMKPVLVSSLYSSDYSGALGMLRWMFLGDYLKIAAWAVAMPALAFVDLVTFFWTEAAWFGVFLILSLISVFGSGGLEGVGVAFFVSYIGYLAFFLWHARVRYGFHPDRRVWSVWLAGFGVVVAATASSWSETSVSLRSSTFLAAAAVVGMLSPTSSDRLAIAAVVRSRLARLSR